ncbi:MAG: DALR anticodon-binding domain-containing protein, partial [Bacteroidales bacterium]
PQNCTLSEKDIDLVKLCLDYPSIVQQAGEALSPAIIANYIFELAKAFNSFYQDTPILREEDLDVRSFRLALSQFTAQILASGLRLLGIGAPEKM